MDLMQAPQQITRPPPQRHLGMNGVSTQWPFLGLASIRFRSAGESRRVFPCRFHSCRHRILLLVSPFVLPAQRKIFSIRSYLHALGTVLGFYPSCAQMQPAKKETANPQRVPVRAVISQQETKDAKACVSHASKRRRRGDRDRKAGDRADRCPGALAAGDELAKE